MNAINSFIYAQMLRSLYNNLSQFMLQIVHIKCLYIWHVILKLAQYIDVTLTHWDLQVQIMAQIS